MYIACNRMMYRLFIGVVSMVIVTKATECQDTGKLCWWWSYMKWCSPRDSYSIKQCPRRCDLCPTQPPPVTSSPSLGTSVPNVAPSVTQSTSVTPSVTTTITPTTSSKSCQLPKMPFSRNVLNDMYIIGHILSAHTVVSETQCEDFCLRAHACLGFNINTDELDVKQCELLDHVDAYTSKVGSRFCLLDRDKFNKSWLGNWASPWKLSRILNPHDRHYNLFKKVDNLNICNLTDKKNIGKVMNNPDNYSNELI